MAFFVIVFFFFKQKTAYEITHSDWSSDVCSSDLQRFEAPKKQTTRHCARCRVACYAAPGEGGVLFFELRHEIDLHAFDVKIDCDASYLRSPTVRRRNRSKPAHYRG